MREARISAGASNLRVPFPFVGDLSKLTTDQFVATLNRKALGPNGNGKQKVVDAGEVKRMVEEGWEYVAQLPDGNVVMRMPGSGR